MSHPFGGLLGLAAGFLLGLGLSVIPDAARAPVVGVFATIGGLFVDLLAMTVLPLVISLIVAGLGTGSNSGGLGRSGVRAVIAGTFLVAAAIVVSLIVAPTLLARIDIDPAAAAELRAASASPAPAINGPLPTMAQWVRGLVAPNVAQAAAAGAILPLIVFAVLFGLALGRLDADVREPVVAVVRGFAQTMQRLVEGLLVAAPFGVFALAVPLASGLGVSAAASVFAYIGIVALMTLVGLAMLYAAGVLGGPLSMAAFTSYCAPAQALALSSRSSLSALPAMMASVEQAALPARARAVLPLALSTVHVGSAVAQTVGALFLARLYAVDLSAAQVGSLGAATFFASIAVPGVPGGSILAMAPVLAAVGLPAEGLGILFAIDAVPDMLRTVANVTGALTVTAVAVASADGDDEMDSLLPRVLPSDPS